MLVVGVKSIVERYRIAKTQLVALVGLLLVRSPGRWERGQQPHPVEYNLAKKGNQKKFKPSKLCHVGLGILI